MSYSQKQIVKLNQEQSRVLDGLTGWTDSGKTINWTDKLTGEAKSFYKRFQEKVFDASTAEAQRVFESLDLGLYDKVEDFAGVYRYTLNKNTIEKEEVYKGKRSSSGARTSQTSFKTEYNEGAKKGHEENVAMHQEFMQAHKERMDAYTEWKENIYPEWKKLVEDTNFLLADVAAAFREYTKKEQGQ